MVPLPNSRQVIVCRFPAAGLPGISSFGNRYGDNAFLGGVTLKTSKTSSLRYNIFYNSANGPYPDYNRNYDSATELIQTIIFTWQLTPKWFYMIEGLYVDDYYKNSLAPFDSARASGINQHLIHTINSKWAVGLRGEWHRAERTLFAIPDPSLAGGKGGDLYALRFYLEIGIYLKPYFCYTC